MPPSSCAGCAWRLVGGAVLASLLRSAGAAAAQARPFQLQLLPSDLAQQRGAQCLDHTPAGYYIRVQDPKRWVVFLEGGGLCIETVDCINRAKSSLGSSKYWKADETPESAHQLTSSTALNPFANWSHVYIPYCSGDTWLGNSKDHHVALLGLQMSGHLILETVLDVLGNATVITNATEVILTGTSAGGIGTFHHIDWFADKMATMAAAHGAPAPRIAGFPVEGVFFPKNFPILYPEFVLGVKKPVQGFMDWWVTNLFRPFWMHETCVAAAKTEKFAVSSCFDISFMYRFIRTPIFVMHNLFDSLMIHDLGTCLNCSQGAAAGSFEGRYIRYFGAVMAQTVADLRTINPAFGAFVTSEYHHDSNFGDYFRDYEKKIQGVSLFDAVSKWYFDKAEVELVEPLCEEGPCDNMESRQFSRAAAAVAAAQPDAAILFT